MSELRAACEEDKAINLILEQNNRHLTEKCQSLEKEIELMKETVTYMQDIDTKIINQEIELSQSGRKQY